MLASPYSTMNSNRRGNPKVCRLCLLSGGYPLYLDAGNNKNALLPAFQILFLSKSYNLVRFIS